MSDKRAIPAEVHIRTSPREPETDPTLGIVVKPRDATPAKHRLVTIGDSLTQGFMSAAVFRTDLSWPAITAYELGLGLDEFQFPVYEWPTGPGGLPLDLERFARAFEKRYGDRLDFWEIIGAGLWTREYMDRVEDFWETGAGSGTPKSGPPFHNMAVYGWDVLDPQLTTATSVSDLLKRPPKDDLFDQLVDRHQARAAWPVVQRARRGSRAQTVLEAAASMSKAREGIETLVVILGANNVLGSVVNLSPAWTPEDYATLPPEQRMVAKQGCNVFRPSAFAADWELLVEKLRAIKAQHVLIATVPSVTIAPIARGTYKKVTPQSRYFPHYTRPWITDDDFDPLRDPNITEDEARAIDSAVDAYNETIIASVAAARRDGLDWYLFDMGAILDRLATRRYIESPWAQADLVDAVRVATPAECARSGPEHAVLPRRTARPHGRRPVLARRGPPDHDRVRHRRPGGHQDHGTGRGRVPRPGRPTTCGSRGRRLRPAAARRHPHQPATRSHQHQPQPAGLAR